MELTVEQFQKEFKEVKEMVNSIYTLLAGHQHDESLGLIHWKKEAEKRIERLERFKEKIIWVAIGMSIPTGLGFFKIVQFIVGYIR